MALDTTQPDYFQLSYINFAEEPYTKNDGFSRLGAFDRDDGIGYVDELLFRPLQGGISGTINSVEIDFEMTANLLDSTGRQVEVREQDQGDWTDTPTTEPLFLSFLNEPWPASLATSDFLSSSTSLGVKTIQSTAALVQYWQDVLDGVKPNDGVILSMNTFFFDFRFRAANIEVRVDFTATAKNYTML